MDGDGAARALSAPDAGGGRLSNVGGGVSGIEGDVVDNEDDVDEHGTRAHHPSLRKYLLPALFPARDSTFNFWKLGVQSSRNPKVA